MNIPIYSPDTLETQLRAEKENDILNFLRTEYDINDYKVAGVGLFRNDLIDEIINNMNNGSEEDRSNFCFGISLMIKKAVSDTLRTPILE